MMDNRARRLVNYCTTKRKVPPFAKQNASEFDEGRVDDNDTDIITPENQVICGENNMSPNHLSDSEIHAPSFQAPIDSPSCVHQTPLNSNETLETESKSLSLMMYRKNMMQIFLQTTVEKNTVLKRTL